MERSEGEELRFATSSCNPSITDCGREPISFTQVCEDTTPDGPDDCNTYFERGWCADLPIRYCAKTCGFCCQDLQVNDVISCEKIREDGLCEQYIVDGYCNRTCGVCEDGVDTAASPTQPVQVPLSPSDNTGNTAASPIVPDTPKSTPPLSNKQQEAQALQAFRKSIRNPFDLVTWDGEDPCTGWAGITCESGTVTGITLGAAQWNIYGGFYEADDYENVVNRVQTSIPPEWSVLQSLRKIELHTVGLNTTLPAWISTLKNLEILDVGDNRQVYGTIPAEYSALDSIRVLHLHGNQLGGTLPPEFSVLTNMHRFHFNYNNLSGEIPKGYEVMWKVYGFPQLDGGLCSTFNTDDQASDIIFCS
eukprot:TRINITY_DN6059_c1_g1_i2.p1 TRINITY_DN6059_c1_g1~~TRINITY_DN6059_c1_g1_i2.p1  ORF type:complete len:362 (+),score=37.10 TRINITY_DN6059_c1_g1_i2:312-1397(+)